MHSHSERRSKQQTNLLIVLLMTGTFMVIEVVGSLFTGSLALLADAGHMLTDVAALGLSAFAMWMAARPSTPEKSYGYHRAEILAAVTNAVVLLLLATWILYEAYRRIFEPPHVLGVPMLLIGFIGLVVNVVGMKLLADESASCLNVRCAYLEVLSDAISSIGVILGGVTIWLTGWFLIDPLLSAGIGVFIVWRTWSLLTQAVHVLMEGVPTHLNPKEVGQAMVGVAGVQEIHDLHIWTITSGLDALSAHVVVSIGEDRDVVLGRLQSLLRERWKLEHTTLQIVEERSDRVQVEKADS
jgi:cobalt-zinc-cadmium efflux system protein